MENEKKNLSTFSVPGTMSDMTLLSTPMPQAASTATKSRSFLDESIDRRECGPLENSNKSISSSIHDSIDDLRNAYMEFINTPLERLPQESDISRIKEAKTNLSKFATYSDLRNSYLNHINNEKENTASLKKISNNEEFEFRVPSLPVKAKKSNSNLGSKAKNLPSDQQSSNNLLTRYQENDHQENDRSSLASSANSSLGIIPSETLEEVRSQPLLDISDLSQRLAQQLSLDTSQLKDMDISVLAAERLKEAVAARCEENKENKSNNRGSSRSSSDYYLSVHGYSSGSDSKNDTAMEIARLSSSTSGKIRPLSERNSLPVPSRSLPRDSTASGRLSVDSNPFSNCSRVSVSSEDFQPAEDAMERLCRDEEQFTWDTKRSLSGIYGDADVSVGSKGDKLSISSFLRSGSGPLGSLEKSNSGNLQRPQFGLPVVSPEKKSRPRPILPPPQDKPTFVLDEVPVKDTPWDPHSLAEMYSMVHSGSGSGEKDRYSDVSVPSLSCISTLLDNMEGATTRQLLDRLMGEKNQIQEYTLNHSTQSNSSHTSALRFPQTHKRLNQTLVTDSICNVTDFGSEEEAFVSIMTTESMDFDIFNDLPQVMEYRLSKACYVNDVRNDAAAFVHLPLSELSLNPGQKYTISVNIAPLIPGPIKVKIEISRTDPKNGKSEINSLFGKIIGELPKISLLAPELKGTEYKYVVMKAVKDRQFKEYSEILQIRNDCRAVVHLKLTINQMNDTAEQLFHFGLKENKVILTLEAGQTISQSVFCEVPDVFKVPPKHTNLLLNDDVYEARVKLDFDLATTDLFNISLHDPVTLFAPLSDNFFCAPSTLFVPEDREAALKMFNSSDLPVSFNCVLVDQGFIVEPTKFTIQPHHDITLWVSMTKEKPRLGQLYIESKEPHHSHLVRLQPAASTSRKSSLATPFTTPRSSRSTTPTSPCSSVGVPVEELRVSCTEKELIWGGCTLHQRTVRVFCLKNPSSYREKLRLSITDSDKHGCFKLLSEKDILESEIKLSLQPMENRQISVVVLATSTGPKWGCLTISRISSPMDKKLMPLYAFGGRSKMNIEGVLDYKELHIYLTLQEDDLASSFVLKNVGDYTAFFKISEDFTATPGLSISPSEQFLQAGESRTVEIILSATPNYLDELLQQPSATICVSRLIVCYGEDSTRQRLQRLHCVEKTKVAAYLAQLGQISTVPIPDLHKLDQFDPVSSSARWAETLWNEDVQRWTISVVVKRSVLETLQLDTTVQYVDLYTAPPN